jgi:uncharacterized membrane protein
MAHEPDTTKAQATNIDTVVRLEAEDEKRVSHTHRFSEAIGSFAGTNFFILLQLAFVALWVSINTGALGVVRAFDPYPFPLLAIVLALEGVLLTAFVLISQKRMSQRADQRSHLDLQINLLAEKEVTKVIQLLQGLSRAWTKRWPTPRPRNWQKIPPSKVSPVDCARVSTRIPARRPDLILRRGVRQARRRGRLDLIGARLYQRQ